jgi:hypothetical protein
VVLGLLQAIADGAEPGDQERARSILADEKSVAAYLAFDDQYVAQLAAQGAHKAQPPLRRVR